MDWHELEKKKVDELRVMAKEQTGIEGAVGLKKDELVKIVADAMGIEKPHLVVEGIDKGAIKERIKALKADVVQALDAKDHALAKRKRRQIHALKRRIRKAAHLTH
ncbi:MAG: hypothetical protein DHS20C21_10890 [Gemmatimonadota bacterium]|nr:MAG: hypothetical protein DHS20C21_10890 [Gemmatimonadota bacterium]